MSQPDHSHIQSLGILNYFGCQVRRPRAHGVVGGVLSARVEEWAGMRPDKWGTWAFPHVTMGSQWHVLSWVGQELVYKFVL